MIPRTAAGADKKGRSCRKAGFSETAVVFVSGGRDCAELSVCGISFIGKEEGAVCPDSAGAVVGVLRGKEGIFLTSAAADCCSVGAAGKGRAGKTAVSRVGKTAAEPACSFPEQRKMRL